MACDRWRRSVPIRSNEEHLRRDERSGRHRQKNRDSTRDRLCRSPDPILAKIAEMRELGFSDPVQMITSNPTLLSYSLRNIRAKIENLREFGFDDPVKLITSQSTIAGLGIDNICGKIPPMCC